MLEMIEVPEYRHMAHAHCLRYFMVKESRYMVHGALSTVLHVDGLCLFCAQLMHVKI